MPRLENVVTPFRGVSTEENATLGCFAGGKVYDRWEFRVSIDVVSDDPLRSKLLIDRDFLDTIELNMKRGEATIKPLTNNNAFAEICQIKVHFNR